MNCNRFGDAELHQHYPFSHFSTVHYHYLFFQGSEKALESADCHPLATDATKLCNTTGPWQM